MVTPLKPFWFFDLPGCLDPRKFLRTAQLVSSVCCAFLDFFPPQPHNRVGCQKASVGRAEKSSLEYGWLHWC